MMDGLVIFGTGPHARKAYHCAALAGMKVVAFADENSAAPSPLPDVPMIAPAQLRRAPQRTSAFVAIGRADVRRRLMDWLAADGWTLPALVHPSASVAPDASLGAGVLVGAGAVVESGCRIGRGAIVDVGAIVDHDCQIEDYCHLRPGQVCPAGSVWPA